MTRVCHTHELLANREQPGTVVRARDDPVAAQLAAQDLDLGSEEPDAGVPARGAGLNHEVSENAKPT